MCGHVPARGDGTLLWCRFAGRLVEVADDAASRLGAFGWVRESVIGEAGCLTLVETTDVASVAKGFGGALDQGRVLALDAIPAEFGVAPVVGLRRVGGWVVAVENNGWQGSRPEILRRVSAGRRAVSMFWNVESDARFSYAAGGEVVTAFDPVVGPERREGARPDQLEAERAGLPWGQADPVVLMLTLGARVTGQAVVPGWLSGEFTVVPLREWPEDVPVHIDPQTESLSYEDPPLAWALRHASEAQLRSVSQLAAEFAIAAAGADSHPAVAAALAADPRDRADLLEELAREILAVAAAGGWRRQQGVAGNWHFAVEALRSTASRSALEAAFTVVTAARTSVGATGGSLPGLRAEIMSALGDPDPPSGSLGLTAEPGSSPVAGYRWVTRHWLGPVGCVAFIAGDDVEAVARALGGDLSRARTGRLTLTAAPTAALRQAPGWVIAIATGYPVRLSLWLSELWRRESAGSDVICAMWEARGRGLLWHITGGRVRTQFDPQQPDHRGGDQPHGLDTYLTGLQVPIPGATTAQHVPVLLAMAQRITGIAFTPRTLDSQYLLVPLGDS